MMVGQTISHYKLVSQLGEGGMGVVYKAEDTKLERTVALKFLAQHLLNDEEAKARFLREAKAAAALHHPNICPVYEIDDVDGKTFISMAFLKGETLEDRIAKDPLSLKDALDIARQAADGLEAAHEAAIIHRDIKPANIMVDEKGRTTIMDFGLARLTEASRLTKFDTAMGTVAYMSPEQGQGMEVDSRSDLWSLGCVLYEMVSGQRPFQGQYDQALLYEIVHEEPAALTGLRTGVPIELELLASKCLAKDREDRYQHASDTAVDLRTLGEKLKSGRSTILRTTQMPGAVPATMTAGQTVNPAEALTPDVMVVQRRSQRTLQAFAAVLALALLGVLAVYFTEAPIETPLRRFSFVPPPDINTDPIYAGLAVSPNGRHIAFTTAGPAGMLWVQDLDQDEPRELAGTEGAILPFWSPNSEFIGFAAAGELRKVSVLGGAIGLICRLPIQQFYQGAWNPIGDTIVFGSGEGVALSLYQVSAQGGTPQVLVADSDLEGATGFVSRPRFLPLETDPTLLFTLGDATNSTMYAKNLNAGQTEELGLGDRPVYSASTGHLIYQPERNVYDLWARPFSPESLQFTGAAFPVRENARQPSLSEDGTLAYLDGGTTTSVGLFWVDREGQSTAEGFIDTSSPNPAPALSPEGRSVAYRDTNAIWVQDLLRGSRVRLTDDAGPGLSPVWSPDGGQVAFSIVLPGGLYNPVLRAADGSGETIALYDPSANARVWDWSRDGRIVLAVLDRETGWDLWYRESTEEGFGEPRVFLQTASNEDGARISPNGRYIAYVSDESGQREVYMQPFPEGGRRTAVSTNGGIGLRWSRDGRELFYGSEALTLFRVEVSTEGEFSVGATTRLFPFLPDVSGASNYDVSLDGQRFFVHTGQQRDAEGPAPRIRIVLNWYEEFRDREQ